MQTTDIWEACAIVAHVPEKTQPQDSPGKVHWELEGSTCVAKGRQPKAGGLVNSSGPDLLSQLDLFLEISFPVWRQSAISKRGWTSITSVDLALSIVPGM